MAIILSPREERKDLCSCCLMDPKGSREDPGNRMCTTKGAIGILSNIQEVNLCSEVVTVSNGRCERVQRIREAAQTCKALHPNDSEAFFRCFIPAFKGGV